MKTINYAVVGLGIGKNHVKGAAEAKNCRLYAVCDLLEEKLAAVRSEYPGVKTFTSYEEMLSDPEIDVVSVATPSGLHASHTVAALRAGKHVLLEKPIEVTLEKAEEIERVRKESGLKVGCIFQNRHNAVMAPMKEAIEQGRLGKIFNGNFRVMWRREQSYYDVNGGWHGTWAMDGGGSLINQSIHTVDLMQWLMGDVATVKSVMRVADPGHRIETEDFTASLVTFKSGAAATFTSTTAAWPGFSTDIQVNGTEGGIWIDGGRLVSWKLKDAKEGEEAAMLGRYGTEMFTALSNSAGVPGHDFQVQDMVDAVLEDRDPFVTPVEAMKALKIVLAIYESARTGREIAL